MHVKRLTCASAIAIAIGVSGLTAGVGVAAAQPGPAPCGIQGCQGPSGPGDRGPGGPGGPGGPNDRGGYGWGAPPPDQGWRGIDQGRFDHQPFNYNGNWVTPIFNPDFNNWGFWFLGIWIPL
ncbi:MAG: hypothetical protein JWR37_1138 [Mycobacterium sp.]|nr:hypothetical protein [Mycobacterium sp.]